MMKCTVFALASVFSVAAVASAQDANPMTTAIKAQYELIKGNVTKAAAKMAESDYGFAPTPEVRNFGGLVGHVANANYMICAAAAGEKNPSSGDVEKTATAKADLEKALAASFTYCDGVFAKMTDTAGLEKVKYFLGEQPKLAVLAMNNAHNMEHYGNIVTYMRMKGLVPPSSESR